MTSDARKSQIPSWPFASPVSGRSSTVYGIFISGALRLELRGEVLRGARDAVLVRRAIHDRFSEEVAVRRRRGRGPFERCRLPRVRVGRLAPLDAHEEVDDEEQLEQPDRKSTRLNSSH